MSSVICAWSKKGKPYKTLIGRSSVSPNIRCEGQIQCHYVRNEYTSLDAPNFDVFKLALFQHCIFLNVFWNLSFNRSMYGFHAMVQHPPVSASPQMESCGCPVSTMTRPIGTSLNGSKLLIGNAKRAKQLARNA
jgi:hypothetical protein